MAILDPPSVLGADRPIDPSKFITGATLATQYPVCTVILVGITDTYRIYGLNTDVYVDLPMIANGYYFMLSSKITTTGGAAVTDGAIFAGRP